MTWWLEDCGIVIRLQLRRGDYVPVCPAGLQYLALPSLGVCPPPPLSLRTLSRHSCPSVHPCDRSHRPRSCRRRRRGFLSKEEGRKLEMTAGDGEGGGEAAVESGVRRQVRGNERREKLHPFGSHPRTPSGLKKSIKRREARRVEGDSWSRTTERGVEERGKKRERERERVGGEAAGEQTALSSG